MVLRTCACATCQTCRRRPRRKKAGATNPGWSKMARDSEMQEFTRSLFRGRPDLSTLTHSIVRQKFLAHVGRDHLEPEEKQALKRLVEEELLKMQVDEAGIREKRDFSKKVKRPPTPSSDPERKRSRFHSESELSSAASSPECFGSPAKNGMAAAAVSPRRSAKKAMEESSDKEEQRDVTAKMGLEELVESSEEEEKSSARTYKVCKEESNEEEEYKGRTRKKTVTKNKQTANKASASKKQARKESEDSEEEPIQRMGRKGKKKKGAISHHESEMDEKGEPSEDEKKETGEDEKEETGEDEKEETGEDEKGETGEDEKGETPAKKKEGREEKEEESNEECRHRAKSNGGKRLACEESFKQRSRAGRGEEREKEEAGNGDNTSEETKSKNRSQWKGGKRQNGSSVDDGEDSCRKVKVKNKGTRKAANVDSTNSEESDSEREVSGSEAGQSPKGERNNHSSKKTSKKGRKTRSSSSSSSDGSPEPKGRKAVSGRRGEDHPAVMRLKRYIRACGAYRNYKKLLGACHSHKERLSVLRAELEALGMQGNPSMEKCRALKEQREEAAEVASLDVANIISSSGRPRRRTAWNPSGTAAPSEEPYRRTLDSEDERPRPPPPDWSHMHGIISSDGEST